MEDAVHDGETQWNAIGGAAWMQLFVILFVVAVMLIYCFGRDVALYAALICALCVGRVVTIAVR